MHADKKIIRVDYNSILSLLKINLNNMILNFRNSFGEIYDTGIYFGIENQNYRIKNDTIKQMSFIKIQKYNFNYVLFFIAIYL